MIDQPEDTNKRARRDHSDDDKESDIDRYWREIKERQTGENTPEYDPWMGGWF